MPSFTSSPAPYLYSQILESHTRESHLSSLCEWWNGTLNISRYSMDIRMWFGPETLGSYSFGYGGDGGERTGICRWACPGSVVHWQYSGSMVQYERCCTGRSYYCKTIFTNTLYRHELADPRQRKHERLGPPVVRRFPPVCCNKSCQQYVCLGSNVWCGAGLACASRRKCAFQKSTEVLATAALRAPSHCDSDV